MSARLNKELHNVNANIKRKLNAMGEKRAAAKAAAAESQSDSDSDLDLAA